GHVEQKVRVGGGEGKGDRARGVVDGNPPSEVHAAWRTRADPCTDQALEKRDPGRAHTEQALEGPAEILRVHGLSVGVPDPWSDAGPVGPAGVRSRRDLDSEVGDQSQAVGAGTLLEGHEL